MDNVNYSSTITPADYKCGNCGATGIKLWREYQTIAPKLLCATCAAKDQRKSVNSIDAKGMRRSKYGKTDQIGWYVPAVPTEDGIGYWGYTSVPQAGCDWWDTLPTLKQTQNELS